MNYTDPQVEVPVDSDDVDVMICELAKHNIGFMIAGNADEDDALAFLVFGL